MRELQYLSPTSISKFESDVEDFYLNYLSDNRPPRQPQTLPMAIGSSFDAYAKSFMHEALFGKDNDPKYSFEALFEAQVEPQNRDWARDHGKYVFEQYRSAGALADLMTELREANGDPRFEFEVKGAVQGFREGVTSQFGEVVLLGKPDVAFINKEGAHVILDFKVNGYCSRTAPSPLQGYLRMRSAGRTNHGSHKSCVPMNHNGMLINISTHLDKLNVDWARQLSIYGWLMGAGIGHPFIVAIDQIVCDATRKSSLPTIRIAEHRLTVSEAFQQAVFCKACTIWEICHSDHIFRDLSLEASQARCRALDQIKEVLLGDGSARDQWFCAATRG